MTRPLLHLIATFALAFSCALAADDAPSPTAQLYTAVGYISVAAGKARACQFAIDLGAQTRIATACADFLRYVAMDTYLQAGRQIIDLAQQHPSLAHEHKEIFIEALADLDLVAKVIGQARAAAGR